MTFITGNHGFSLEQHTSLAGSNNFFYVAVAASAGGFEALKELVGSLLAGGGNFAIIFSQPLEDNQENALAALLSTNPLFKLCRAYEGEQLSPGNIYTCPPGEAIKIVNGAFSLQTGKQVVDSCPADLLFQSVAVCAGQTSIAVVLSGTGCDGAAGVKSIKAAGGRVLVQMPQTAKYDGMPKAAIETACADEVLNPANMGKRIAYYTAMQDELSAASAGNKNLPGNNILMASSAPELRQARIVKMAGEASSTIENQVKETLYASYQHAYAVVDATYAVKEFNGEKSVLFKKGIQKLPCNLWDVLNDALHAEVRSAVEKTISEKQLNRSNLEIIELENKLLFIRIIVKPVEAAAGENNLYIVIFENLDPCRFIAKGIEITDKIMVGAAMQQLAGRMQTIK